MKKIAMIGIGKLGQDCAEVMAHYYDVVGYDIEPRTPAFPMKNTIEEAVVDRDIIFIAAPTPHDPLYGGELPTSHLPIKDFDYTIVSDILDEVNKYVTQNLLELFFAPKFLTHASFIIHILLQWALQSMTWLILKW